MKNNLCKARLTKKRPSWIDSDVWNALDEKWKNPEYKKKCMQAKTNRASDRDCFGKPLHTCGSITTSQHRANLVKLIYFVYINMACINICDYVLMLKFYFRLVYYCCS